MTRTPNEIRRLEHTGVQISWTDGAMAKFSSEKLRKWCPCAECREKRGDTSHAQPLISKPSMLRVLKHSSEEELSLQKIWQVGNYALGIEWGDGHKTGIYTWSYLDELESYP